MSNGPKIKRHNILNIANRQGKANQIPSPHSCQNGCHQKKKTQIACLQQRGEKGPCTLWIWMNVNWCSHYERQYGGFTKNRLELLYGPAIPPLDIYMQKKKKKTTTLIWKYIYTPVVIGHSSII